MTKIAKRVGEREVIEVSETDKNDRKEERRHGREKEAVKTRRADRKIQCKR